MGQAAKEVHLALQRRIHPGLVPAIEEIQSFEAGKGIVVGDIFITPFPVDHSAYDGAAGGRALNLKL